LTCFSVDSADFGPTLGCAGAITWELKVLGKTFHSGLPHKGINSIDLAGEVVKYISAAFHEKYKKCEVDEQYKFIIGSSFKATQISVPKGGLNQIPGLVCEILHKSYID
jgi:acetylornithine deacetylase